MFVTDLAGSVYSADLDGKNSATSSNAQGNLTGIAYVEIENLSKGELIMSTKPIRRIAIIGTGVIGAKGWSALFSSQRAGSHGDGCYTEC